MADSRIILIFTVLLVSFMLWPIRSGELWITDDHEIVSQTYQYASLKPASFFSRYTTLLLQTEVGFPETASRYRPIYHAVRTLKNCLVGDNAKVWFLWNAAYCLIGMAALGLALGNFFPWFITLPFLTAITVFPFHADMWPRLGPSENDAFIYTACFVYSCFHPNKKYFWPLACIFAALAIGSKENFLLLLLPLLVVGLYGIRHRFLHLWSMAWVAVPLAVAIPVTAVVVRSVVSGKDIYLQSTSSLKLFSLMAQFLTSRDFLFSCLCLLPILICFYRCSKNISLLQRWKMNQVRYLNKHDVIVSFLVFISIFFVAWGNFVFYRGAPWHGMRYGFPYYMLLLSMPLCSLYLFRDEINTIYANKKILISSAVILFIFPFQYIFIEKNNERISRHIILTKNFSSILEESAKYKKIILINTGNAIRSYEPYASMKLFARSYNLPPVFYFPFFSENSDELGKHLAIDLRQSVSSNPIEYYLDAQTILLETEGSSLRKIEHATDTRNMEDLLFSKPELFQGKRNNIIIINQELTVYIPMDDPDIVGFDIAMADENDLSQWHVSVNGIRIDEQSLTLQGSSLYVDFSQETAAAASFPQLPTITFTPIQADPLPLRLRTLRIVRN